jgi:hypothetical protein
MILYWVGTIIPSLLFGVSFDLPPNLEGQLRQFGQTDIFARVKRTEDLLHSGLNTCYQLLPSSVQ